LTVKALSVPSRILYPRSSTRAYGHKDLVEEHGLDDSCIL
jgi:hypothetical protein